MVYIVVYLIFYSPQRRPARPSALPWQGSRTSECQMLLDQLTEMAPPPLAAVNVQMMLHQATLEIIWLCKWGRSGFTSQFWVYRIPIFFVQTFFSWWCLTSYPGHPGPSGCLETLCVDALGFWPKLWLFVWTVENTWVRFNPMQSKTTHIMIKMLNWQCWTEITEGIKVVIEISACLTMSSRSSLCCCSLSISSPPTCSISLHVCYVYGHWNDSKHFNAQHSTSTYCIQIDSEKKQQFGWQPMHSHGGNGSTMGQQMMRAAPGSCEVQTPVV